MRDSLYADTRIALRTKHEKAHAIEPAFEQLPRATVFEYRLDSDSLGTVSGEIARAGSAMDAAKEKTRLAVTHSGSPFALVS